MTFSPRLEKSVNVGGKVRSREGNQSNRDSERDPACGMNQLLPVNVDWNQWNALIFV
jgi:hypothetical protein